MIRNTMFLVSLCWILALYIQGSSLESVNHKRYMNINDKCKCGMAGTSRIINGQIAKPHAYPWMVAILDDEGTFCGGSLINDRYVLTAGHCGERFNEDTVRVKLGAHEIFHSGSEGYIRNVKRISLHPDFGYSMNISLNDIALMELEEPVVELKNVSQICLPPNEENNNSTDNNATLAGWGYPENNSSVSKYLREATVKVISNDDCSALQPEINENMICALGNGSDACNGDSGSPLFVKISGRYGQIGLTSFGPKICATPGEPSVYTRVSKFMDWILEETQNAVYCS